MTTKPTKNFFKTRKIFFYNSKKTNKCKSFKKKHLSWKSFTGHVKRVCDNHVEEFIDLKPKNIRPKSGEEKKANFSQFFSQLKCTSGNVENSFDKPIRKTFTIAWKFLNQCLKTLKNVYFSPRKKPYLKLFFRTCRRQFCQYCCRNIARRQKCFAMKPKNLRSMSDHDKVTNKLCSINRFSSKCANRHDGSTFGNHIGRFCQRAKNVRPLSEKGKKNKKISKLNVFPQSGPMVT